MERKSKEGLLRKLREEGIMRTFTPEEIEQAGKRIGERIKKSEISHRRLRIEKSYCCRAQIKYTGGGLIIPYCSKCKKNIRPIYYK